MKLDIIHNEDCLAGLKKLPDNCIDCCVTSPPYWGLRDYNVDGQLGLEKTPEEYVAKMVDIFSEVKRVLKKEGTLWLNLGDSYAHPNTGGNGATGGRDKSTLASRMPPKGTTPIKKHMPINLKPKDLVGIPWMVAFALRADGWYLRMDIIWHKRNPMPESITDRPTKSHEYIFLMSKSKNYYYEAIQEIATGYDGRKDIIMKGSKKYQNGFGPTDTAPQSIAVKGHERWKFKNLKEKGQQPNTIHEKRANRESDELYPVRNKRSVWPVNTKPYAEAHFATFPENLIVDCIKAGCPENGIVLDPFMGAGTTGLVAKKLNRNYIGYELNSDYTKIAEKRIFDDIGLFVKENAKSEEELTSSATRYQEVSSTNLNK